MIGNVVHRMGPAPRSLAAAGWLATWSVLVGLWLMFRPWPYPLVMTLAALTPWSAVWLAWRDPELSLFEARDRPGSGNLTLVLLAPSLALGATSLDQHFMDFGGLLAAAGVLGAVFWTAVVIADTHGRSWGAMAVAAIIAFAWGWGVVTTVDLLASRNDFTIVEGVVEDAIWPSRGSPSLNVSATVNGRRETFDDLNVTRAVYGLHPVGTSICIEIHKGLLGSRHAYAVTCPLV
ncbi:hypothetical protein AS593_10955 [Caulobacter vibrioides]|nr:hypothetical protein AS593_10955 [Caulobacter vibrioides]